MQRREVPNQSALMSIRRPAQFVNFPKALSALAPFGPYVAVVNRVIDGDTFDVLVDLGFNVYEYAVIRIEGVDAPEMNTPEGKAAKAFLEGEFPPGTPVVLDTKPWVQTFGRYVARVTYARDGLTRDLAAMLIETGHAIPSIR